LTYKVVHATWEAEGLDVYGVETDFTPFRTKV
jgi:hypothetical protein